MPRDPESTPTKKGARTRARILEVALARFVESGYEQTTMRAIAEAAGVSLGNAYYYFDSKESLIQAFYARTHEEHLAVCEPLLERETKFKARLHAVMRAKVDTIRPYHRFAGQLFKSAADPSSPLNPFSELSSPLRREATDLFGRVVEGSNLKVRGRLERELPGLLWTYHMGIILYWIHDPSPDCARTYRLVDATVNLLVTLVKTARLPLLRPVLNRTFRLLDIIQEPQDSQEPQVEPRIES